MFIVRIIAVLLLSFSVGLSGFPAQAMMQDCPMAAMEEAAMQPPMVQDHAQDHDCCPKEDSQPQSQKKSSDCCDDGACNAACAVSGSMNLSTPAKGEWPPFAQHSPRPISAGAALASHLLNTQDRPPKFLC